MRTGMRRLRIITHVLLGFVLLLLGAVPQATSFAAKDKAARPDPRLDVVVLVDVGARNFGESMQTARRATSAYIRSLPKVSRVGIVTYSGLSAEIRSLSTRHDAAIAALSELKNDGPSNFYDGLDYATEVFDGPFTTKRQIVVVTDGSDSGSTAKLDQVASKLAINGVRVDVLAIDSIESNPTAIELLTKRTGGNRITALNLQEVRGLAVRATEWARPPAPPAIPRPQVFERLLASKIALGFGMLLVFGALTVVMLMVTAPKPKKVELNGFQKVEEKSSTTPLTGIAERLTSVADKALERQGKTTGLNVMLERAGINLRASEFVVIAFAAGMAGSAIGFISYGLFGAIGFAILGGIFLPRFFLKRKAKKRSAAFGDQLSDTLQLLSSSLRAGQGLMQAVDSVAREGDPPASEEFRRVVVEARLGRDLVDSLRSMCDRLQSEDFQWVIPAIEINREVGGDLAEVLDTVGSTVRDRADIRRQVKTLSAEGRLSAYVLLALPCLIALAVRGSNPAYIGELTHGLGLYLAGFGILLMVIGGFWLFSLCNIEF